jgi:hypothetical protein
LRGKRIALVGSGPGVLDNAPGFIDSHDVVARVSNYKLTGDVTGRRTDVFCSFFGTSIKKTAQELKRDGVYLCICKCPNSQPLESEWHRKNNMLVGIDYRYIYHRRADWWFCPTFVPTDAEFLNHFEICQKHQPTTGFDALLTILECEPASIYLTGFDFFESGLHNVNEKWEGLNKNQDDPIRHRPDLEKAWLKANRCNYPISFDQKLRALMEDCDVLESLDGKAMQ